MEEKMFAVEMNLNFVNQQLQHKTDFNEIQVRAYLGGLSTYYSEVLIVCYAQHVLVLARGTTADLLVRALGSVLDDTKMIKVTDTTKASEDLILKVAKGERWKDVDQNDIRHALEVALTRSVEADCLGMHLQRLSEKALNLNYLSTRPHTWQDRRMMVLKYPTVADFDFDQYSLN